MTKAELIELAGRLSKAQKACGDVLDDLPCTYCGSSTLRGCTLDQAAAIEAAELINDNPGLMDYLHAAVRRSRALAASQEGGV